MILLGKFNSDAEDVCIQSFCEAYGLKTLIMETVIRTPTTRCA